MNLEDLIDGFSGEVNIESAEQLIAELSTLSPEERTLRVGDINEKVKTLQEQQNNGIDAENIRIAIAKLTHLREEAEQSKEA